MEKKGMKGKVTYTSLFNKSSKIILEVIKYAIQNNEVDERFHIAIKFINDLTGRSLTDANLMNKFDEWLENGSTIELKDILYAVGYKDFNLVHFNAFALIDAVHCKLSIH